VGLPGVQQTKHISPLFQLLIQILPIPRRGFHPNENLAGHCIQLMQFLLPDLPSLPSIGKKDRFDYDAFVEPENAARAGLASDVNPTDILDRHFLRGECRRCRFHRTPAFWCSLHLWSSSLIQPSTLGSRKPDQPGRASAHTGSAISPGTRLFRNGPAVATSLIDPFYPDGRGAVYVRRSLCFYRPQALTPALLLPPSFYSMKGLPSWTLLPIII